MNNHIIFTVVGGRTYNICYNEVTREFSVSSETKDIYITTQENAEKIATDNSNGDVKYKIKDISDLLG